MLNKYNSNSKKQIKSITKVNPNNLNDDLDITGSLLNVDLPTTVTFQSTSKVKSNKVNVVNTNKYTQDMTRLSVNAIRAYNNKNTILDFHDEILQFSGRSIRKSVDSYSSDGFGKLIISNVKLDYGTEGASPNNFEVLVGGLNIPGNYKIEEIGNDVVITLNDSYIDFSGVVDLTNIYVIGKFINI